MKPSNLLVNEQIANLLENKRTLFKGAPIAFDGLVDEASFLESRIKTVYLLKEVNDPDMSEDWRTFMEDTKAQADAESMYKTWPNICLWVEAMKNESVTYSECIDEYGCFATKKLQKNLLEVGIVNIKKTAGKGSSSHDEIFEAAQNCGFIIREEIDYINPQLVICGGTFDYAKVIFDVKPEEVLAFSSGAQYFVRNEVLYLQFVHPVWYSVNRKILFAYAKLVFEDVRKFLRA